MQGTAGHLEGKPRPDWNVETATVLGLLEEYQCGFVAGMKYAYGLAARLTESDSHRERHDAVEEQCGGESEQVGRVRRGRLQHVWRFGSAVSRCRNNFKKIWFWSGRKRRTGTNLVARSMRPFFLVFRK